MDEREVARLVEDLDQDYLLRLLEGLAGIPSVKRETEIARFLYGELQALGWQAELQELGADRANVIARVPFGRPGRTLMLNGHLDNSDLPAGWIGNPYRPRVEGEWFYGPEVNNMKGAVAAKVAAIRHLQRLGVPLAGELVLAAVGAECDALGWGTVYALQHGLRADACIVGEPTDFHVTTFHPGPVQAEIHVRGKMFHIAEQEKAVNANVGLAHLVTRIHNGVLTAERGKYGDLPRLMVGVMRGGKLPAFAADEAVAVVDARLGPGMTPEQVRRDLERVIEETRRELPWLEAEVRLRQPPEFCPAPAFEVTTDLEIVQTTRRAVRLVRGEDPPVGPYDPMLYFATDARHLQQAGIQTIVCGPGRLEDLSKPQERMRVDDIVDAARVFAAAALLYLGS